MKGSDDAERKNTRANMPALAPKKVGKRHPKFARTSFVVVAVVFFRGPNSSSQDSLEGEGAKTKSSEGRLENKNKRQAKNNKKQARRAKEEDNI
jgi:hypothetical protein